ncbi:MAG: MraZ protein [Planctomycetota bacterium]
MFEGQSTHVLDAKGRLCIPKRIQEQLTRTETGQLLCVVTRGFDGCLNLFAKETFDAVRANLATDPFVTPRKRRMQRLVFPNTVTAQLDSSGRLLIPEKLKKLAGLDREVVIVGVADRAEIWNTERWERFEEEFEKEFDELDGALGGGASGDEEQSAL